MASPEWKAKFHNFDPDAILRGAQLTLVGAHRALQNPRLFTNEHYRQAALAVAAGVVIRIIIEFPIIAVRLFIWFLGFFTNLEQSAWDNEIIRGLSFIENSVLQVPFFLMSLMRYMTPTLDNMFMESLDWVDRTYVAKHTSENPDTLRAMYYPNLSQYTTHSTATSKAPGHKKQAATEAISAFLIRFGRRAAISLGIYVASFIPYVGRFILPAVSFWTFKKAVGTQPAAVIFATSILLPKRYLVHFLQAYFSSRSLMRELLVPYFSRVHFNSEQKRKWFKERQGVLFGFGVGFYILIRIPLVGVLVYGIAEASTAYLITKITDPPPPPAEAERYVEGQVTWKNKHEFMKLPLTLIDAVNTDEADVRKTNTSAATSTALPEKQYS